MADERTPLLDRLASLRAGVDRIQEAIGLRTRQNEARARWLEATRDHPPRTPTVVERHAALTPGVTRIETTPDRGRILRMTEAVGAGEIVLAEPALVRVEPASDEDPTPPAWRPVAALACMDATDRALILTLHDAHEDRRDSYAQLARDLIEAGVPLGPDPIEAAALLGIIRTNAFGRGAHDVTAIYPAIAMAGL